jgi:hypothetical protein
MNDDSMTLEKLRANREALRQEWLRRVEEAKAAGITVAEFNATGPVWDSRDTLWMFVRENGRRTMDIGVTPAGEIVEFKA